MTIFEFNPPLQLCNDPNCKIVSLGEAAELLAAHVLAHADREAARFCDQIKHCTTPEVAEDLANAFRNWAMRKRLVVVP
jgi:hypothetical protein